MTTTTFSLPPTQWVLIAGPGDGPLYFSADAPIYFLRDGDAAPTNSDTGIALATGKYHNVAERLTSGRHIWAVAQTATATPVTVTLVTGAQATVRQAQPKEAKWASIGDSQCGLGNAPVAITGINYYDSTTGYLDLAITSHGTSLGTYIHFTVKANNVWNNYKIKVETNPDAARTQFGTNNLSIRIGAGLGVTGTTPFTASDARWGKYGSSTGQGYQSWVQSLTKGKVKFLRAAGVTGEQLRQICARIPLEILPILSPGDTMTINGIHNDLAARATVNSVTLASSTVTWANGIATAVTTTPHYFNTGDQVHAFNLTSGWPCSTTSTVSATAIYTVTVTSPTSFTYPLASDPGVVATVGAYLSTGATLFNTLLTGVTAAVDYGLNVIVINGTPFGAAYSPNDTMARSILYDFNRRVADLPRLLPNVAVVDAHGGVVDQTLTTLTGTSGAGTAKTNYIMGTGDSTHWTPLTVATVIAPAIQAIFDKWYPDVNRLITSGFDCYDATSNPSSLNLFANGGLTTVTGGGGTGSDFVTGTMGSNWSVRADANNGSLTLGVQQASWSTWLGNSAKVSGATGLTFTNQRIRFLSSDLHARFSPEDEFILRMYFKTSGLVGLIDYFQSTIYMAVDSLSTITIDAALGFSGTTVAFYPNTSFDGYIETAPQKVPAGSACTFFLWEMGATINGSTSGNFFLEAGQVSIEKVRYTT